MKKKPNISIKNDLLRDIRANRRRFRAAGLSQCELTMLEEIALQCRGHRMRRLRGSYLALALGVSRQWANALLRRLDALGLIVRMKTGFVYLIPEKVKEIRGAVAKVVRRKQTNWLKRLRKSARGNNAVPTGEDISFSSKVLDDPDAQAAMSESERTQYWLQRMGLA